MILLNYIICFLKACIILNLKVVLNDIFKFGGERVKQTSFECHTIRYHVSFGNISILGIRKERHTY